MEENKFSWPIASRAGLAQGWEGFAWVELQKARLGPLRCEFFDRLHGFLRNQESPSKRGPGLWYGTGGVRVVLAHAAALRKGFLPDLRMSLRSWDLDAVLPHWNDLSHGQGGALQALTEIRTVVPRIVGLGRLIRRAHQGNVVELERRLRDEDGVKPGFFHGIAGLLFAAELGRVFHGLPVRKGILDRARDFLGESFMIGPRGALWPVKTGTKRYMPSLCSGNPGILLALHYCRTLSGHRDYEILFRLGLRGLDVSPGVAGICCGFAGAAQASIEFYRQTGDRSWLTRASATADRHAWKVSRSQLGDTGFLRGELGLSYTRMRLEHPNLLPFPGMPLAPGQFGRISP